MNNTCKTITQALSKGFLASELDMDSIRRFCALSIYHRILTMVEEGKQVPQDIVEYS
jgi:hypothetical protein